MQPEDKEIFMKLIRKFSPRSGDCGPCPDAELLAGFAGGSLLREEQEAVERHLAGCEHCLRLAAGLAKEETEAVVIRSKRPIKLLAASLLFALALAGGLFLLQNRGTDLSPLDPVEGLAAAARKLALLQPERFGRFRPIPREALRNPPVAVLRGTRIPVIHPAGKTLNTRPHFRWEAVPLAAGYRLFLMTDAGKPVWEASARSESLAYPAQEKPLVPGQAYFFTVTAENRKGHRRFQVASNPERQALESAFRTMDTCTPEPVRPLLKAHFALQEDFLEEAEIEARRYVRSAPAELIGRETLFCVLKRLGSPEADGIDLD